MPLARHYLGLVDLEARTIIVRRSHEHDETKGKKDAVVPIADELVVYLERALKQSASGLVFPKADGTQQPRDLALHRILRRAMGRAGVVSGYHHRCRRKGCGFGEERADAVNSTCPKCSMKLWVSAIPRPIRFHSTRHTTATLLLKAKVPLAVVQRVLRHSDPNITASVYGHLDIDDMRAGVNVLGTAVGPHLKLVGGDE